LSGFVLFNVARHLRQTFFLFLQGRPANFDEEEFVRSAAGIEGVARIDSIRAWSLDGNAFVLAMRLDLSVATLREAERVKGQVRELAAQRGADRGSIAIETRPAAAAPGSHLAQQPPRETEK
jgi:cobalt-zinc-cadmium efflux system protein